MNKDLFENAKSAAAGKNYQLALSQFTQCLQDKVYVPNPGEIGQIYHQIGNCLVHLKNYKEATNAYAQALGDAMYDGAGSVHYNMGQAYAALHDQENAILHFQSAASDGKYSTPYKAYNAMGSAYLKTGRSAEAGVAFRQAALDDKNPDPAPALLNLGVCFMALDRPADAVASYESALPFDADAATKNKIYANLGQAYVACGQMKKAVSAFESALADKTYFLSDSAAVDYQKAVGQVAQGTDDFQPVAVDLAARADAEARADAAGVAAIGAVGAAGAVAAVGAAGAGNAAQAAGGAGVSPDQTAPFDAAAAASEDLAGLDVSADGTAVLDRAVYDQPQYAAEYENYGPQEMAYGISLPQEQGYFDAKQQQKEWEKNFKRASKKRHPILKFLLTLFIIVLVVAAAGVFFYTQGYGYPTQEMVVTETFKSPSNSAKTNYVSGLSDEKISSYTDMIVQTDNVTIDGVNRTMNDSTVYATATTSNGGQMTYEIELAREQITWKIASVKLYFASQQ